MTDQTPLHSIHFVLLAALERMEHGSDVMYRTAMHAVTADVHAYSPEGVIADEYVKASGGTARWAKVPDLPGRLGLVFRGQAPRNSIFDSHVLGDHVSRELGLSDTGVDDRFFSVLCRLPDLTFRQAAAAIREKLK